MHTHLVPFVVVKLIEPLHKYRYYQRAAEVINIAGTQRLSVRLSVCLFVSLSLSLSLSNNF